MVRVFDTKGRRIELLDKHFLAEGGQGRLFALGDRVYKIYHLREQSVPVAKLLELQTLTHAAIVRPLQPLFDAQGQALGYMMARVNAAVELSRLFTTSFQQRHGIGPQQLLDLLAAMREAVAYVHGKGFLQVDGNEFNYLVNNGFRRPWLVDVDSYQTPGYPATGIMAGIQDYTQRVFNEGSDWYAFAVIGFQLFTGIHPYKGRHPDYGAGQLAERVRNKVSVFDPAVAVPSSVRDMMRIPGPWLRWFRAVFQQGERMPPPDGKLRLPAAAVNATVSGGKQVQLTLLAQFPETVKRFRHHNGLAVVYTAHKLYVGKHAYDWPKGDTFSDREVVLDGSGRPLFLMLINHQLHLFDAWAKTRVFSGFNAEHVFVINNIAYLIHGDDLLETRQVTLGGGRRLAPMSMRRILPGATEVHDGIVVQNILGKTHLMIPVSAGRMPMLAVPELDGLRIVEAVCRGTVAVFLAADADGEYRQWCLRFDRAFAAYDIEELHDDADGLNFAVLKRGEGRAVMIRLPARHRLQLMAAIKDGDAARMIADRRIEPAMRLVNDGERLACYQGQRLYRMQMRD